jgi:AhpD family alkylhydroperoxidase
MEAEIFGFTLITGVIVMSQRLDFSINGKDALKALFGVSGYLAKSGLEKTLLYLIDFRVSQINGCAYCLDMHSKDLRAEGETEQRLYVLNAWRESPFYSDRERAALAYAEELTVLNKDGVSDEVYDAALAEFGEKDLIDLTVAVTAINTWNRLNIAFHTTPGNYQPGMFSSAMAG